MRTPVRSAPNRRADGIDHLHQETRAVLDAAAVAIGAFVGPVSQKLIDQVAVGGMHLDPVEPGGERITRALRILLDDRGHLFRCERARRRDRLEALLRERLRIRLDGRGGDRQRAGWLEGRVRDAADMPKLQHDGAPGDVYRLGHAFPAFDLLGAVNTGRGDIALPLWRDLRCFRNDQSRAGALGIIESVERMRDVSRPGAAPRQGRHDDAVPELQTSNADGTEEIVSFSGGAVLHCGHLQD